MLEGLLGALLALGTGATARVHVVVATNFWAHVDPAGRRHRDRGNPDPTLACLGRPLDDDHDAVVASRTLPCGTRLRLYAPRTGLATDATVADRGPYGANRRGIDLAPVVARALGANGRELVIVVERF